MMDHSFARPLKTKYTTTEIASYLFVCIFLAEMAELTTTVLAIRI